MKLQLVFDERPRGGGGIGATAQIEKALHQKGIDFTSLLYDEALELANNGYITATDLADYIVKNHSKSFREAYQKTAAIINMAEKRKKKLDELTLYDLKKIEPNLTEDVLKVFDLKNSVNSKKSYGGTAFDNIKKMIIKYKKQL